MARGGRRPGAGARRGNFNAVRSGKHSPRMAMVYLRMLAEPDKLGLGRLLLAAGLVQPPPHHRDPPDVSRVTEFLWHHWFDSSDAKPSNTINDNQPIPSPLPAQTPAQIQCASEQCALSGPQEETPENK